MAKYHQGKYNVKIPEKYSGDPTNVVYRSSWELKFMNWCDLNSSVFEWSSEETIIPYRSPVDNKPHRYFVDFKIKVKSNQGIKTYLVEIKPSNQRLPPTVKERKSKKYLVECSTFLVNQSKWEAADRWAKDRGWEFIVLDEFDLGLARQKIK
jgi:hypothetical protein